MRGASPLAAYYSSMRVRPVWLRRAEALNSMLVNDMRVCAPDYFSSIIAFYSSLSYNIFRAPGKLFIPITIEGLLQNITVRILFEGVPTDSGAVIPVKRFAVGGYRSYTASWALLYNSRGEVLVPYAGIGLVRAKPNEYNDARTLLVIDSLDDVIGLTDATIMERAYSYRGDIYGVYYDYLRVGVNPPGGVVIGDKKYVFDERRGPLKLLHTDVYVLKKPLVFLVASVESVVSRLHEEAWRKGFPVSKENVALGELLKILPAIGFKKEAMLEWVEEYAQPPPGDAGPEYFLFAEVDGGNGYVALRPMPRELWRIEEVIDGFTFNIRPAPPYYYGIFGERRTPRTPHIIPGSRVLRLPRLRWEGR